MDLSKIDDLDATARILKKGADRGDADAQYMYESGLWTMF